MTKRRWTIGILLGVVMAAISLLFLPRLTAVAAETNDLAVGEVNNLVVFVRFAGEDEFVDDEYMTVMNEMYNTSEVSVKQYFYEVSMGKLTLGTHFLMPAGQTAVSVQVARPRGYYKPYHAQDNPIGYRETGGGGKEHIDRMYREQQLVREVLRSVVVPENVDLDGDGDGLVDSLTLMISGEVQNGEWSQLLWPHMYTLYSFDNLLLSSYYVPTGYWVENEKPTDDGLTLNSGLEFEDYNLLSAGSLMKTRLEGEYSDYGEIGVICHELMHTLGAMDYYSYESSGDDYDSVGELDIMGATDSLPQYPLSYLRRQMGWLEDDKNIVSVSAGGTYTLYPVTDAAHKVKAYQIKLVDYEQTGEYFMIEARSNGGTFDGDLSSSGLIVYRINEAKTGEGNMEGADEVFVFRTKHTKYNATGNVTDVVIDRGMQKIACSYAIFGQRQDDGSFPFTPATYVTSYGLPGTSKVLSREYPDLIYYRGTGSDSYEDKNSGLAIEDITVNADGSVTFRLNFDGDRGSEQSEPVVPAKGYPAVYRTSSEEIVMKYSLPTYNGVAYTIACAADQVLTKEKAYGIVTRYFADGFLPDGVVGVVATDLVKPLVEYHAAIGGLTPETPYKCYTMIVCDNTMATAYFSERTITTFAEGTEEIYPTAYGEIAFSATYPKLSAVNQGKVTVGIQTEQEDCWCFYVVLPFGSESPTLEEVLHGQKQGVSDVSASAFRLDPTKTNYVINLEKNRQFDLYLVLKNETGVSEIKKISLSTTGSTKADTGISCTTLGCATTGSVGTIGGAALLCLSALLLIKRRA